MALLLAWFAQHYDDAVLLVGAFFLLRYSYSSVRLLLAVGIAVTSFTVSYQVATALEFDIATIWLLLLSVLTGLCSGFAVFFSPWIALFVWSIYISMHVGTIVFGDFVARKFYSASLLSVAAGIAMAALAPVWLTLLGVISGAGAAVVAVMMLLDSRYQPLIDMQQGFPLLRAQPWTLLSITLLSLLVISLKLRHYLAKGRVAESKY